MGVLGSISASSIVGDVPGGVRPLRHVLHVAESGRAARPGAAACANSGRRGMGRIPRKCKLRGPSGDPVRTLWGPRTFRRGLIGEIRLEDLFEKSDMKMETWAKFRQNLAEI